jgi:hypothetical protein
MLRPRHRSGSASGYDAGATNAAMSGRVEARLPTGQAARIAELHAYIE